MSTKDNWKNEKSWKNISTRSEKLKRAKQLGIPYPRVAEGTLPREPTAPGERVNVLFVCSRNQWRSPTAERLWRGHPVVNARSAGTSASARHPVSDADISWADVIMVMEQKHKNRLTADFGPLLEGKTLHVLDIPDEHTFMDPELVEILESSVGPLLGI